MVRPWREQVREAFGHSMARDAKLLGLAEHGVAMYVEGDTVHALSPQEQRHVRKAQEDINNARRRLKALSKRCTND